MTIDWNDKKAKIGTYFTVGDATLLPSWGVYHVPSDAEKANILAMAAVMDKVRELLGKPIKVHCWIRPTSANCPGSAHNGSNYNEAAGSTATHSAHIIGRAVDWDAGENCDATRSTLMAKLEEFGVRMEDRLHSNWVHLDNMPVPPGGHRFFKP